MRFPFTAEARAQLRAIDRTTAIRILETIARFGETSSANIEPLDGEWHGYQRLRIGDYRVIFRYIEDGLEIVAVGHRSEVYK